MNCSPVSLDRHGLRRSLPDREFGLRAADPVGLVGVGLAGEDRQPLLEHVGHRRANRAGADAEIGPPVLARPPVFAPSS